MGDATRAGPGVAQARPSSNNGTARWPTGGVSEVAMAPPLLRQRRQTR